MAAHRDLMGEPRRFGNVLKLREESADVWGWATVDAIIQDLRYAFASSGACPRSPSPPS